MKELVKNGTDKKVEKAKDHDAKEKPEKVHPKPQVTPGRPHPMTDAEDWT